MGMSIDKAIKHGTDQLEIFGGEHKEFIETALDTMRKCQKIEEILKDDYEKDCGDKADFFRIGDIRMTINGESR